jgi:gluconate:H+ symporter, GntP family
MAITAGGVATHALVPPTPGPLFVANALGVDLGV